MSVVLKFDVGRLICGVVLLVFTLRSFQLEMELRRFET